MQQPSIFLSHNYRDKPFVRTLAQDLSAMGVRVWLDEAELKVGDSLITRNNDYLCVECGSVRPFAGDSATVVICPDCGEGSLGVARFCEWCGTTIRRISGQSLTYRCPYDSGRVVACLCSSGDHKNALDGVLTLDVHGRELTSQVSVDSVIEEIYVAAGQLVFRGTPLYRVVRLG